jgi:hypothetical protein
MTFTVKEYMQSMKAKESEEFFDLVLHRPLAYLLAKLLMPTRITPNGISWFSVLFSTTGAVLIATNNQLALIIAGIMVLIGNILDCADGQLARMRGKGSQFGRIVDGAADYLSSIVLFVSLILWHSPRFQSQTVWGVLVFFSGLVYAWQSQKIDYHRTRYLKYYYNEHKNVEDELHLVRAELESLNSQAGMAFRRFSLRFYLNYTARQSQAASKRKQPQLMNREEFLRRNKVMVRLWCFSGSTTPRFLFFVGCCITYPELVPFYVLAPATLWIIIMSIVQSSVDKKVAGVPE